MNFKIKDLHKTYFYICFPWRSSNLLYYAKNGGDGYTSANQQDAELFVTIEDAQINAMKVKKKWPSAETCIIKYQMKEHVEEKIII